MPASVTSSGTWTTRATDFIELASQTSTTNANASLNVPNVLDMQPGDFAQTATAKVGILPEVLSTVELFATNLGTTQISFWQAAAFLRAQLTALFTGNTSTIPTDTRAPAR